MKAAGGGPVVDHLFRLLEEGGAAAYFGEPVSQLAHSLQTAYFADGAGAPDSLVVAALLHDVGHLLHSLPETIADRGLDGQHEEGGAHWLSTFFGEEVTAPIRLHVSAKRYLCAVDPSYRQQLSHASEQSLQLQGGPFRLAEVQAFEKEPFYTEAVQLRRWDDQAKIADLAVPELAAYRRRLEAVLKR